MTQDRPTPDTADSPSGPAQAPAMIHQLLTDDGIFPNNGRLPLLLYPAAVEPCPPDPARVFEARFAANGWAGAWRNGIYGFHHYHSNAHEVLGVYSGSARVRLGGEQGITRTVRCGDVIVIPAGIAHRRLSASDDFRVVGAYPSGRSPDLCRGRPDERPRADRNIAEVPLPPKDPVFGLHGPLQKFWPQREVNK